MTILECRAVSVNFDDIRCLDRVDFSLNAGELIGLVGPNGAGKSSLLKVFAGVLKMSHGSLRLHDKNMDTYSSIEKGKILGYLEQNGNIHWPLPVQRLVEFGRLPHMDAWHKLNSHDRQCVRNALEKTDTLHLAQRNATMLSGGEKSRVLLARVLAAEPEIILADEPIAALDPAHKFMVMNCLQQFVQDGGAAIVALHDLNIAAHYCTQIALIDNAKLILHGTLEEVLTKDHLTEIFGVKATIDRDSNGNLSVLPYALADT